MLRSLGDVDGNYPLLPIMQGNHAMSQTMMRARVLTQVVPLPLCSPPSPPSSLPSPPPPPPPPPHTHTHSLSLPTSLASHSTPPSLPPSSLSPPSLPPSLTSLPPSLPVSRPPSSPPSVPASLPPSLPVPPPPSLSYHPRTYTGFLGFQPRSIRIIQHLPMTSLHMTPPPPLHGPFIHCPPLLCNPQCPLYSTSPLWARCYLLLHVATLA